MQNPLYSGNREAHIQAAGKTRRFRATKIEEKMQRADALEIAKQRYAEFQKARTDADFGRGPEPKEAEYGYRHGWITVSGHSFNDEDLTGQKYDITQGGWAFL